MQEQILEITATCSNFNYLKELFKIMDRFNVHRIYMISNKNGKLEEAHQKLEIVTKKDSILLINILLFIREHIPFIYFSIIMKCRLNRYKRALKCFMEKYEIETIGTNCISLYHGIYISKDKLCISGVSIVFKDGQSSHFDKLYLEI